MKKILLLHLLLLSTLFAAAQDIQQNFLDSLSGKLITEIRKQGRPKALLETDKSIFKAGETVWFTAMLVNSVSGKIFNRGTYLFVDLVNEKDSVITFALLDAATQQLSSKLSLPAGLAPGYYWLRAYNQQIAESDINDAFVKPIYIVGANGRIASRPDNVKKPPSLGAPTIDFYPEGGAIMTGANSTVAISIRDASGNPIATEGFVKDTRDSIVARFSSNQLGLAKFDLTAASFRRYKAYINLEGKQFSYPLPAFNFFAGQVAVTKQPQGNRVIRVLLEDSIYKKNIITYLIGISKDSLCYAAIGRGQYEVDLPEQRFPKGPASFYLFDQKGTLLSERSIYINNEAQTVTATLKKGLYSKREKVDLNISVKDANHFPVPALLTISVADSAFIAKMPDTPFDEIINAGLLPKLGLLNTNQVSESDIDLLMLLAENTYKTRVKSIVTQPYVNNDRLLFIRGRAYDGKDKPASNKILTLLSNSGAGTFLMDTTDNAGQFSFPIYQYADSTEFTIEAKNINSSISNVKVIPEPLIPPHFTTPAGLKNYFQTPSSFDNKYRTTYLDSNIVSEGSLKEVTVTGLKQKNVKYNEAARVSPNSTIVAADQLDERRSIGDILLNVGGLHIMNGFLVVNGLSSMNAPSATSEPLLVIDGIASSPGTSNEGSPLLNYLNALNPKDIDFIEILKGPEGSNFGMRGGNGVIILNMVHSRRDNVHSNSNFQTFYAKGISRPSIFPVANYDNKAVKSSTRYDNRSTIYWNGKVLTAGNDQSTFSFYTSDVPTTYKVTITGVTVHGDRIYKTVTFYNK